MGDAQESRSRAEPVDDEVARADTMAELIELSSFGSPEVKRYRSHTPPGVKQHVLANLLRADAGDRDEGPAGTTRTGPRGADPYFFLSHARDAVTGEDADVRRFFLLLCAHLDLLAGDLEPVDDGASRPAVRGHLAGDAPVGTPWQTRMLGALSSVRVFVPLLSPGYFESAACRHEWDTFKRRDDVRRQDHPFGFSAIVPVLWTGAAHLDVPAWAESIEVDDTSLGREYLELGIGGLMNGDPNVYRKVVFRIARRIRDVAECLPPPPD